jgi:hypothetical protein
MKIEPIQEPISVRADFSAGAILPRSFQWHGRSYPVQAVNGQWLDRQSDGYRLHYSVQSGDETYYIHFSSLQVQWWLDQVALEG